LSQAAVTSVTVAAYTIPTDAPEADGTFAWTSTTLVLVEVGAGGKIARRPVRPQPCHGCRGDAF